jgi:ABC-type multidrug transport system fused ATPase/permease subunit
MTLDSSELDNKKLNNCISQAGLDDLVSLLPNGLGTYLSSENSNLSGGEIQRIGIARALYVSANLLVFDEPTSALDSKTEAVISRTLGELKGVKTVVVIAHRIETISMANKILHLSRGKVDFFKEIS